MESPIEEPPFRCRRPPDKSFELTLDRSLLTRPLQPDAVMGSSTRRYAA